MPNILLLVILAFYTLFIVGGINYYQDKINNLNGAIGDYERAIRLYKTNSSAEHYTQLQLDNKKLKRDLQYLSQDNDILQDENKILRQYLNEGGGSQEIQYESHTYKSNTYDSSGYEKIIEL